MASSTLDRLPAGARTFIDANIFIYHFTAVSRDCRSFLERCEARDIEGVTSVVVLAEVAHRLMMLEAVERALVTPGNVARKLNQGPDVVKKLGTYREQVERIPLLNVEIRDLKLGELLRAAEWQRAHGLMVNDSLVVASARGAGIERLASADSGLDGIGGLTRFGPADLTSAQ